MIDRRIGLPSCVGYSADSKLLALGGADHHVQVYERRPDQSLAKTDSFRHSAAVEALAFQGDTHQLLTQTRDGQISLWRVGGASR